MNKKLFILAGILVIALLDSALAQSGVDDTEQANVSVTVSAVTMIDIAPATLSYIADPGGACGVDISGGSCNETTNNYFAIQVENIGSWNITSIWFNVSQPTQTPFAVGNNTFVDPGNFVALTTNETTDDFFFVDRKEYKAVASIVYLRDPEGSMPANMTKYNYGRLHNGSNEYFYMLENTSTGSACNISELSYIRMGISPRTQTEIGSTDFTDGGGDTNYYQINLSTVESLGGYAVGNVTVGPMTGYAVAVENQTCAVRFSKWNKDIPFDNSATNYSFNGMLTPGNSLAKKIGIIVPYGIYEGTATGQLTAIAIGAA